MNAEWTNVGNITVIQAALAVGARDGASVTALASTKTAVYLPAAGAKEVEFRFKTPADADAWVVELYAARGSADFFTRIATLTLTGGTQVAAASKVFVDTLVGTNEAWLGNLPAAEEVQSATNFIARYHLLLHKYSKFVFIASTIESGKTLEVEAAEID